ncbi:hypothetical protein FRB90_007388 [Tulasnella sp. 427]|nr:hypothetical protein FRB90_007388 [Tulasnella sp. 427]
MSDSPSSPPTPTGSSSVLPHSLDTQPQAAAPPTKSHPLITVILPSRSITFKVPINPSATVNDLKNVIHDSCPGRPAQSGQRIIWKGRFLKDEEVVEDVVNKNGGVGDPTVYLAVHPSSWTESEPNGSTVPSSSSPLTTSSSPTVELPTTSSTSHTPGPSSPSTSTPLPIPTISATATTSGTSFPLAAATSLHVPAQFVMHQHSNAIRVLAGQPPLPWLGPSDFRSARNMARGVFGIQNIVWPLKTAVETDLYNKLQKDPETMKGGVVYEWKLVDNLPYLSVIDPTAHPNLLQKLALETLTHTYPLLPHLPSLPPSVSSSYAALTSRRSNNSNGLANDLLVGGGGGGRNHIRAAEFRFLHNHRDRIPPHALPTYLRILNHIAVVTLTVFANPSRLLLPICMIIARAGFVMYIFRWTPDRSIPWFLAVLCWMCYEIWGVVKAEMTRIQAARAAAGGGAGAGDGARNANPRPAAGAGDNGAAAGQADVVDGAGPAGAPRQDTGDADALRRRGPANGNANANPAAAAPEAVADPVAAARDPFAQQADAPLGGPALVPNMFASQALGFLAQHNLEWERRQLGLDSSASQNGQQVGENGAPVMGPEPAPTVLGPAAVPPHLLEERTGWQRVQHAVVVFVLSMFPELWARRVEALRIREGQVRIVYGREWDENEAAVAAQGDGNDEETAEERARRERRRLLTGWRRDYVRRVLQGLGQDADL